METWLRRIAGQSSPLPTEIVRQDEFGDPWRELRIHVPGGPYVLERFPAELDFPRKRNLNGAGTPKYTGSGYVQAWAYLLHPPMASDPWITGYLNQIIQDRCEYPERMQERIRLGEVNIYWDRYLRPEAGRIPMLTLIDLYLITSNYYDRYPARKYLSYLSDYSHLGIVESNDRLTIIDSLVALSLAEWGRIEVIDWKEKVLQYRGRQMALGELLRTPQMVPSPMVILRLQYRVLSEGEDWPELDRYIEDHGIMEYYHQIRNQAVEIKVIPPVEESVEEVSDLCILCERKSPLTELGLCGHGVCQRCQEELGTIKCPFCSEHFICEDFVIEDFMRRLNPKPSQQWNKKIQAIREIKEQRAMQFDWSH